MGEYRVITGNKTIYVDDTSLKIYPKLYVGYYKKDITDPDNMSDVGAYMSKGRGFEIYEDYESPVSPKFCEANDVNSNKDNAIVHELTISVTENTTSKERWCKIWLKNTLNYSVFLYCINVILSGKKPDTSTGGSTTGTYKWFKFDATNLNGNDMLLFMTLSAIIHGTKFLTYHGEIYGESQYTTYIIPYSLGFGKAYLYLIDLSFDGEFIEGIFAVNLRNTLEFPDTTNIHIGLYWDENGKFDLTKIFNKSLQIWQNNTRIQATKDNCITPNVIVLSENNNSRILFSDKPYREIYDTKLVIVKGSFTDAYDESGNQDYRNMKASFHGQGYIMEAKNFDTILYPNSVNLLDGTSEKPFILHEVSNLEYNAYV